MGFFSKKITTDKINEALLGLFDAGYDSLVMRLKDSYGDEVGRAGEMQDRELITIPMFAIIKGVTMAFGNMPEAQNVIGKFQHDISSRYFKETGDQFRETFWQRCDEYSQVLRSENKDLAIQVGQIFCTYFWGDDKENGDHLAIMMFVGGMFVSIMLETKRFLDEVSSNYEIV
jgi:hypothetical protein